MKREDLSFASGDGRCAAWLLRSPYDHFEPFGAEAIERISGDQVAFLRRSGLVA